MYEENCDLILLVSGKVVSLQADYYQIEIKVFMCFIFLCPGRVKA